MQERMNRSIVEIKKQEEFDKKDELYWAHAPIEEKFETITFLRECFYGKEATTGRLQRVYKIFKQK